MKTTKTATETAMKTTKTARPTETTMKTTKISHSVSSHHDHSPSIPTVEDASLAFENTRAEREALTTEDLLPMNLDVGSAALIAIGAFPKVIAHVETVRAKIAECAASFDNLLTYAHAANYAHYVCLHASPGNEAFQTLVAKMNTYRTRGFAILDLCVAFGSIEASVVAGLREGGGYRDLLDDVGAAESIIRARWSTLENRVPFTAADLDEMRTTAATFATALAARETVAAGNTPEADDRQRAFTLLGRAYDQVRRALTFVRWTEDDVDQIAPSLYLRPGGGRRGGSDIAKPAAPTATPTTPAAPATVATQSAVVAPAAPAAPVVPGPKGTPFTS